MITVGSLFSGIGGIDYAFREAGFRIAWQVEVDAFCRQVLAKHFPDAVRHADIYDCHDLPHVDVLTAGFPCQPFSLAGKRLGEQDERYLIPEMFRVIQEVKPYVILFENVPGFASITDGATFRDFLRALAAIGFDAEWTHLRASDAGAPHRRERWFCVAYAERGRRYIGRRERGDSDTGAEWGDATIRSVYSSQTQRHRKSKLVNTSRTRRQKRHTTAVSSRTRRPAGRHAAQWRNGFAQSSVCGSAHGLPARLDGHIFPAPPGIAQHPAEPPRVTTHAQDRAKRLKALGNAVVPQCVYPIALAIREWFEVNAVEDAA